MDLSQLKWLKNVHNKDVDWVYKLNEMPIPEARVFLLHWRKDKIDAQQPLKGDLIALVQSARGKSYSHSQVVGQCSLHRFQQE